MYSSLKVIQQFNERILDYAEKNSVGRGCNDSMHTYDFEGDTYEINADGSVLVIATYSDWRGDKARIYYDLTEQQVMQLLAEITNEVL